MPFYDYQCAACDHAFEALQKISDAPLTECPGCHQPSLKKKVSAPAFRLSGGGWYETDFKSGNKRNLAGESASTSSSSSASDSGTSSAATTKSSD